MHTAANRRAAPDVARGLSVDDANGMCWWNNMSESDRAAALNAARASGQVNPSPADAWHIHKRDD